MIPGPICALCRYTSQHTIGTDKHETVIVKCLIKNAVVKDPSRRPDGCPLTDNSKIVFPLKHREDLSKVFNIDI